MIIDVHGHAGPWFFSTEVGSVELNLALMDRYGIERQVVSASEAVTYDMVSGNSWLAEVLETQPRLLGYVVVNPNDLAVAARELERYRPTGRFVGVKVHTTYRGRPLMSAAVRDALRLAAEAGLPVLVHPWDETVLGLVDVLEADLTDDEYDHVMWRNAVGLFGLEAATDPTA
ncbi:amidohydrolase family protein [Amycolatopsis sp. NPDC005232]|uniref:amidohydrolase family protein n=1 Tax=Amycolatopsis sp. NPDC005232 TaxID=3157027 RepID=UPI0033BF18F4